jgi:Tfp pilus assembly protein PilF
MVELAVRLGRMPGGTQDKAEAILRYIFTNPDGLQFEYRNRPTLTAAEAFEARAGNCMSLVNLFISLARAAGLDAFPLEVRDWAVFSREGSTVVRSSHVIGGLTVGGSMPAGRTWTIDFLPGERKAYRRLSKISDRRHAALYYSSVGVEAILDGDPATAEGLFAQAVALDHRSAEAWSNYAVLARRQGDLDTAFERLEKAVRLDADYMPALTNMASFHRLAGRGDVALSFERRALEAKLQNPYFLIDQALRRLQRDEIDGAYELVQKARRIDSGLPEVYLVLGRIDLARGRSAHAERNFATAREKSLDLSPAYRQGVDRKIGKLRHLASLN